MRSFSLLLLFLLLLSPPSMALPLTAGEFAVRQAQEDDDTGVAEAVQEIKAGQLTRQAIEVQFEAKKRQIVSTPCSICKLIGALETD